MPSSHQLSSSKAAAQGKSSHLPWSRCSSIAVMKIESSRGTGPFQCSSHGAEASKSKSGSSQAGREPPRHPLSSGSRSKHSIRDFAPATSRRPQHAPQALCNPTAHGSHAYQSALPIIHEASRQPSAPSSRTHQSARSDAHEAPRRPSHHTGSHFLEVPQASRHPSRSSHPGRDAFAQAVGGRNPSHSGQASHHSHRSATGSHTASAAHSHFSSRSRHRPSGSGSRAPTAGALVPYVGLTHPSQTPSRRPSASHSSINPSAANAMILYNGPSSSSPVPSARPINPTAPSSRHVTITKVSYSMQVCHYSASSERRD